MSCTRSPAALSRTVEPIGITALQLTLRELRALLADDEVTELCINRPGEVFVESGTGWRREALPFADLGWCNRLAKLVANATHQRIDECSPLLSGWLPGGERVQIVVPPATSTGTVAIAIRRPSRQSWSVAQLCERGALRVARAAAASPDVTMPQLQQLAADHDYEPFLRLAVRSRLNILISGPTGSGKTTWTRALIQEIPAHERLVTIEDTAELVLHRHPNAVQLYYSKDGQGLARVAPKQLLDCSLRLRPDRILLAELRGEEAFDYLRCVNSGHPGSITSVHAGSAELALEQLVLLVKQSASGRALSRGDIRHLLHQLVDVIVQCGFDGRRRYVREVWFAPGRRLESGTG